MAASKPLVLVAPYPGAPAVYWVDDPGGDTAAAGFVTLAGWADPAGLTWLALAGTAAAATTAAAVITPLSTPIFLIINDHLSGKRNATRLFPSGAALNQELGRRKTFSKIKREYVAGQ